MGTDRSDESILALLDGLRCSRPDEAWKGFLDQHAGQIMRVVRQRGYGKQMSEDCFLSVCERLSDDRFARLLQFDDSRGVPFRGWLNAVVVNLCSEWHRAHFGRRRVPQSIARLSSLDRHVFRYRYLQELGIHSCLCLLHERFPDITRADLSAALSRIQSALTGRQRWRLANQQGRVLVLGTNGLPASDPPDPQPGPEQTRSLEEGRNQLRQAVKQLDETDRYLLRLRFEHDMSYEDVARVAGLTNLFQARRRVKAALARLAAVLSDE